jgi:FkbM family methyltransferase
VQSSYGLRAVELLRQSPARPWIARAARRSIGVADNAWTRPLLARLMERLIKQVHGEIVAVRFAAEDDCWVIEWPAASVPMPDLWHGPSPSEDEKEVRDVFFQEYEPGSGDVVVDVGAGTGTELNLFSEAVGPAGHVYAIEADPRTFQWLSRRKGLNKLPNVTLIHAAAADRPGEVLISSAGPHETHRIVDVGPGHRVAATALDELAAQHGIRRIDLLKINVEGAERLVLAGMNDSSSLVRNIVVSCHDYLVTRGSDVSNCTKAQVYQLLRTYGFEVVPRRPDDDRDWARDYLYGLRGQPR